MFKFIENILFSAHEKSKEFGTRLLDSAHDVLERLLSTIGSHGLLSTLANFEDLSFLLANVNVTVSTTPFDYIRPLADTREEFLFTASMASGSFILINLEDLTMYTVP